MYSIRHKRQLDPGRREEVVKHGLRKLCIKLNKNIKKINTESVLLRCGRSVDLATAEVSPIDTVRIFIFANRAVKLGTF